MQSDRSITRVAPRRARITRVARVLFAVIGAGGILTTGFALPASGAAGDTAATITITGGSLSITVPTAPVNLGTRPESVAAGTIGGALGVVVVNDARAAIAGSGWVASVISTAFTPVGGTAIAASNVSYVAGPITKVGTATYVANDPPNLTGVVAAVTASGITGDNSATWNPTITVTVAGGMAAAVYFATITQSVA
jgi:hypothetical protein